MALPHDAHPMGVLLTGLAALSTCHPEQNPALAGQGIYKSKEVQDKQIVRLVGKIPTLAAFAYHRASGRKPAPPNQKMGYAEVRGARRGRAGGCRPGSSAPLLLGTSRPKQEPSNSNTPAPFPPRLSPCLSPAHPARPSFPTPHHPKTQNFLYMLDAGNRAGYQPNPRLARALDILFLLHAEHELNCSTSAARHLASSGVDVYTAVQGAVGALYGPLHGGANEAVLRMLQRIGSREAVPAFVAAVKARKEIMFGFGHRVYKNYDPRAKIIRQVADEVFSIAGRDPMIEIAMELEKVARSDDYFVSRKLYPNVSRARAPRGPRMRRAGRRALGAAGGGGGPMQCHTARGVHRPTLGVFAPLTQTLLTLTPLFCLFPLLFHAQVDFYSGLVYRAMGFPPQFFTVLFAVPRVTGYLAHWRETLADPDTKIVRPQQDYCGEWLLPYVPLAQRPKEGPREGDDLGPVPPSAAYTRRVAGSNWQ